MNGIAQLLWNPLLCFVYLGVGGLFVMVTGAVAWRRAASVFAGAWTSQGHRHETGSIPHKEAFLSALSASVGVGNLAGVATAIHLGGPGALFWMWISALFGMYFRMSSTYLAIRYRPQHSDDLRTATPMLYLERFLPRLGILPRMVAALLVVSGLVNSNLIQANSISNTLTLDFGLRREVVAFALAMIVGLVILGGLRSIIRVTARLAPWMLGVYVSMGVLVLVMNPGETALSFASVFRYAFQSVAVSGGVTGYVVLTALQYGVSRGVFSHGAGTGVAPFFQGANSDHPARGAFMAALVPAVDTLIICTITGLVILSKGFWQFWTSAHLTVSAFDSALGVVGKGLVFLCLVVFAFTTMVSWAHFSERCFEYLGGQNRIAFRGVFCLVTFLGPFFPVAMVWSLADVVIGLLLIFHLLPLTYITLKKAPRMLEDLDETNAQLDAEEGAAVHQEPGRARLRF